MNDLQQVVDDGDDYKLQRHRVGSSVPERDGRATGVLCGTEMMKIVDANCCSSGGGRKIEHIAIPNPSWFQIL